MVKKIDITDILRNFDTPELLSAEGGQKYVFTINLPKIGKSILKVGLYNSESTLERIQREVETLRKIDSTYFPKNYGFSIVDSQRYYILEEFLDGGTLESHITEYSSEQSAIELVLELIKGLRILWSQGEKGIVHRDLKPQNIIITNNGPKIIDLGIARLLDETSITETWGGSPRTPAYASPEQIENKKKLIDFRSDQFNLGIIFGQLILSGQHPFDPILVGNKNSHVENILNANWAKREISSRVSPESMEVISKLLGNQPYQRYRKVDELQSAIELLRTRNND